MHLGFLENEITVPKITFPDKESLDSNRDVVKFLAILEEKKIRCAISIEALQDHFSADYNQALDVFSNKRKMIEAKATELIGSRRFEADGSILIRTTDF